jgi:hypothetical protein
MKSDGVKGYTADIDATGIEAKKQAANLKPMCFFRIGVVPIIPGGYLFLRASIRRDIVIRSRPSAGGYIR